MKGKKPGPFGKGKDNFKCEYAKETLYVSKVDYTSDKGRRNMSTIVLNGQSVNRSLFKSPCDVIIINHNSSVICKYPCGTSTVSPCLSLFPDVVNHGPAMTSRKFDNAI